MKNLLIIVGILIISMGQTWAQRTKIKIDPNLRANSESMKIKRKGMRSMGRYEFGPYRVISGKKEAKKSKTKAPIFAKQAEFKSSQKQHFIFIQQGGDTIETNIEIHTSIKQIDHESFVLREIVNWHDIEVQEAFTSYNAFISSNNMGNDWNLTIVSPARMSIDDEDDDDIDRSILVSDNKTEYKSVLSDGKAMIWVKRITEFEDNGKKSIYSLMGPNLTLGYEFILDGLPIAALRLIPLNHQYFWAHKSLSEEMKFVLAAASVSLCSKMID